MRIRGLVVRVAAGTVAAVALTAAGACGGGSSPTGRATPAAPASALASASASRSPRPPERPAPGDHDLALDRDGVERTYHLHAPPGYQPGKKLPLVVVLQFRDGTVEEMREMTGFDGKADREGFLVAYPVGLRGALNAFTCCGSNDDVGFIRTMVEHISQVWGVDPDRVYTTGISNGADMSFRMAVEVPGMFAAIAPVSGGFIGQKATDDPSYKPSRPVSVVAFAGEDDRIFDRIVTGMRAWHTKVGCTEGQPAPFDPERTVNGTPAQCADGTQTVFYAIKNMRHAWPGGAHAGIGDPSTKINAVDVMWTFFAAHPRRA
jgi:polyhydroxybutyrate depolymerase